MFDYSLFLILVVISLPGILGTAPKFVLAAIEIKDNKLVSETELPSVSKLMGVSTLQNLGGGVLFAALGTWIIPQISFSAPLFSGLLEGIPVWVIFAPQLSSTVILGIGGGLVFVVLYYTWYRPQLDSRTVKILEIIRSKLGLKGRLLYGAIFSEVLARWGLLSLFVWLGKISFKTESSVLIWGAMILAGIVFASFHLLNYQALGCRLNAAFVSMVITLNIWTSLIFGWLFWQYSLAAAMLAHLLFQLVWYVFDQYVYQSSAEGSFLQN
jgi:hypothetical protein